MKSARLVALALLAGLLPASHALTSGCGPDEAGGDVEVAAILFIKRQHTSGAGASATVNVAGGDAHVLDYERFEPGGQLVMLTPPRPDGALKVITSDFPTADFNGADVSFDAKEVVFSMKRDAADHYHIYTARLTEGPDGKFEISQLTGGPHDDVHPIYIPGGRVAFVTNEMYTAMGARHDEYNHGRSVTQLATISVEGGDADRRLTAQSLSHTVSPFLRYDGRIGFSRWEHLGAVNDVKLFAMNPDGTQLIGVAGQHGKPSNAIVSVRELEPNVMIGVATARERTLHAGALVRIDARDTACMDRTLTERGGRSCLDEENVAYAILTPEVPVSMAPSPVGRYRDPAALPDGRLLVSWASGPVNDLSERSVTPPDFGVYLFDPVTKKNRLVYNDRATWELNALPVAPRAEPPLIPDAHAGDVDRGAPVRIGSIDLKETSLTDVVTGAGFGGEGVPLADALAQAVKVRVIEGFSTEGAKGAAMFGLTMNEGAAILGEADVYADGSWLAEIPPYVPVHLQPIDKYGLSIRDQRLWLQGMPGEDRRCVGCHERRAGDALARAEETIAAQRGPQPFLAPIPDRRELPWALMEGALGGVAPKLLVQDIIDAKCAQCHSGGQGDPFAGRAYTLTATPSEAGAPQTFTVPYLDLSAERIDVGLASSYPRSYVSLFFPAAMEMGMGLAQVDGDKPPLWAVPSNARASALIAKLNVRAPDGTFAYGHSVMHPEDKGVELTDAERLVFIQSIDLGGQFYARQNTGFVPFASDPAAPGQK